MRATTDTFLHWLAWVIIFLIFLWLVVSLMIAEVGYDYFRWA